LRASKELTNEVGTELRQPWRICFCRCHAPARAIRVEKHAARECPERRAYTGRRSPPCAVLARVTRLKALQPARLKAACNVIIHCPLSSRHAFACLLTSHAPPRAQPLPRRRAQARRFVPGEGMRAAGNVGEMVRRRCGAYQFACLHQGVLRPGTSFQEPAERRRCLSCPRAGFFNHSPQVLVDSVLFTSARRSTP